MAEYRQVHCRMWKDSWFTDLSPKEKLLFVYLFSNERASICGLYELPLKIICFESGLDRSSVEAAMVEFGKAAKVFYENGVVWVVNLRKYNENASPKVMTRINKDLEAVPDCPLKRRYLAHYAAGTGYGMDTLPIPYPETESEQEQEQETEQETETETEDTGAGAPPPAAPKAKSVAELPKPVKVYLDSGGKFPTGTLADGTSKRERAMAFICEHVRDDVTSLDLWGRVVHGYQAQWSAKSYTIMVNEYYLRGRVPGEATNGTGKNGHTTTTAAPLATDADVMAEYYRLNPSKRPKVMVTP